MRGKVCLITGATSGIGRVVAAALAALGAEVVVAGRSALKAQNVVQEIRAETGNDAVDFLLADFSDLQQVRDLAAAFKSQHPRLDVLINNAGAFYNTRQETPFGVEMTLLVNHLAPFLLTNLLVKHLQKSASARIVNVSSEAHKYGTMDFADLGFKRSYLGMKAYARSKLANILFTYELFRRLENSSITVNALHPGHVATDIWRTNFSLVGPLLKWLMGLAALTPVEGADNTIYLASSPEVEGMTGKYFVKRQAVPSSSLSCDQEVARKLWDVSEQITASETEDSFGAKLDQMLSTFG